MSAPVRGDGRASPSRALGPGLFRRIFLTFVITVLASAGVASVGGYVFASRFSADWVADTTAAIEGAESQLMAVADDHEALEVHVNALSQTLESEVAVYHRPGGRVAGLGPKRPPPQIRKRRRELRSGQFVVFRDRPLAPPGLAVLLDHRPGEHDILLVVRPRRGHLWGVPLMSLFLLIAVLGAGSWVLARSLATRLSQLQTSARRIAAGELAHRVEATTPTPSDEIDELALSFNYMAEKVELLVTGQKTLLANVSHELRTPIARVKVLLEILEDRAVALQASRGNPADHAARLHKGMSEMHTDIAEIESLISDLLTSGRLDLQSGNVLDRAEVPAREFLQRIGSRVGARVDVHDVQTLDVDEMLLGRLLSNLLVNARRACPDGEIAIECIDRGDAIVLSVEDEGPGVRPADRSAIFEPFMRLDAARARDQGGVGLGLYLSRQIAAAHGGTIDVGERQDGAQGARFTLTLPARQD